MAELALVSSIIAIIQISRDVITQAYKYGQAVKSAKEDMQRVQAEVKDLNAILIKLKDLARRAEASGRSLTLWPTLVSLQDPTSSLHKCQKELEKLQPGLAPVGFWEKSKARALWPPKRNGIYQILDTLRQQKVHLTEALNIDQTGQVLEMAQVVEDTAKLQIAGCGKTVLCSTIVEDTRASCKASPVAFYYFDITDREKQKVSSLLRSILGQLCTQMAAVPETVSALHKTYKLGSHIPQQPLIDTLDSILPQIDKPHVFIDALDECEDTDQLLKAIKKLHGNLQILVTSQKQSKLSDTLQGIATEISIQSEVIDRDIGLHVQESLKDGKLRQWKNHPIKDKIINTLQDGAGGSFRWVSCQIDSLGGCSSEDDVRSALEDLPRDLNHTYDRILKRIYDQDQRSKGKTAAKIKAALQWLAFARRPLLLQEVLEAAVINPEHPFEISARILLEPHFISDSCSSLVVITASTRRGCEKLEELKFAHPSVQRYLTSERIQSSGEHASLFSFSFSENDAHSFIGRSCLRYLLQFDKPETLNWKTLLTFPLAKYSAKFWIDHYTAIGDNPDRTRLDDLGIELLESERNSFKNWIRICDFFQHWRIHGELERTIFDPPLCYIARLGLLGLARRLLEKGANVNAQGGVYGNALQAAVFRGNVKLVQLLLNEGADVNAQGGEYGNALQAAASGGRVEIVQLLLNNGADVNAQGGTYGNALQAAAPGGCVEIVQLLLNEGADVNAQSEKYGNALRAAAWDGDVEIVQLLLTEGADVNAQGGGYGNALQAAAWRGGAETVQLLLNEGADVNAQGGEYGNALQAAAWKGSAEAVQLLLNEGADVNAQGGCCGSALRAAVSIRNVKIVNLLLDNGADVSSEAVAST
ncbi:P-loop containing nucleoside triphosphate hydrolase [Lasallia pustulata]|uniref:p-loop containing nucleoside triphosphate hydrolase n=1 Tax=Lasallia pustulata TaxID=136370 RepID=A0A1W5CZX9_9LECA|nr:P-loop containing nucleoside triphosphate hydrolase [Lasallia pustulata]